jgi:hypothetical protein
LPVLRRTSIRSVATGSDVATNEIRVTATAVRDLHQGLSAYHREFAAAVAQARDSLNRGQVEFDASIVPARVQASSTGKVVRPRLQGR